MCSSRAGALAACTYLSTNTHKKATHVCTWLGLLQDQSHLAVGCLDGQLKFFSSTGTPKFKERAMDGDVLSLSCLNADYLLAAGSDKYVWWCHMRGSARRLSSALQLAHASFSG